MGSGNFDALCLSLWSVTREDRPQEKTLNLGVPARAEIDNVVLGALMERNRGSVESVDS